MNAQTNGKLAKAIADIELNLHYIEILQNLAMDGGADACYKISDYAGLLSLILKELKAIASQAELLLYEAEESQ